MKTLSESKILIVDDTEAYIDILVDALGGIYEILVATNGAEAMEIVNEDPPDLILLDILMPGMDGYEICRQLKANETTREIPVIFVTSMSDIEDETRGLELGAIDYITKPISASIVRARIRNHLDLKLAYQGIAEQKRKLEEQNLELLEAACLREDVDRIMRHDLKTPLNAIIGFPQVLKLQGNLTNNQLKYIGYIEESGYRMLNMINLSLNLFKMERGIYPYNPESVNIIDVLKNIMNELQKPTQSKEISVDILINGEPTGSDSNFAVYGETLLCYSMLANLIKNAVEASPEGGRITILLEDREDNKVIRIHNQGAVPIDMRDRFFEKYATSGKNKGTGLGTYSAKLIAETQNGKIQMDTSENEGTSLVIELASILIVLMVFLFYLPSSVSAVAPDSLDSIFTIEENEFLAKIGVVRVHNESDWAPFNFNENGSPKGFSIDYMKLLAEKVGLEIIFIKGPSWDEFLDMTKKGKLDIMLNIAKSTERQQFLEFTPSYVSMIQMLYTRSDVPTVSSIKDLYGKRFAVPKGFFLQEVLKAHPQIEIVGVTDTSAAIRAVSTGKADALFDLMPVVDYITNQLQITNLKVGGDLEIKEGKPIPLHIAVRKDIKILASILEKGMTKITEEELRKLHEKWLTNFGKTHKDFTHAKDVQLVLTEEERVFLAGKQIRLGVDTARPPFEYIDEKGSYSGISAEFIIAAAKRIGISIIPQKDIKWTEAMEKVKVGEIDVIPKVTPSAERKKYMIFTRSYTTFPSVIVSRKDHLAGGLDDLHGLKIGVIKGQIIEANLKRDRPELLLMTSPDIKTALRELATGKFDVFIDNLGTVAYSIDTLGLANLRIAASTPYNHDLAFGTRKDWPLLASALDKALASMSDHEKTEIKNRWLSIKYQKGIDWRIVGPIVIALISIITFVLIWNRRLGRAIREREYAERKIKAMGQSMADALVMINSHGDVVFWNQSAEKLFGYTAEEAMGMDFHKIAVPAEVREKAYEGIRQFAVSGQGVVFGCTDQHAAINRWGETFPVEVTLSSFQVDGEWFAVGTVRDITNRKKTEKAIKESEKRFRGYFEHSQIGMAVTHPYKGWIEVNKRLQDMLGYTMEELHQTTWAVLTYPDDLEADIKNFEQMLAGELDDYSMDKRFIRKDGSIVYTNLSVSCLRDEKKTVDLVLASLLDITDRKQSEKQMKEQMEDLERLSRLTINREERMIQLKEEINILMEQLGKGKKYKIVD